MTKIEELRKSIDRSRRLIKKIKKLNPGSRDYYPDKSQRNSVIKSISLKIQSLKEELLIEIRKNNIVIPFDGEEWRYVPLDGYEKYQVSSFGRVMNPKGILMRPALAGEKKKYLRIGLCNCGFEKSFILHRLIAIIFIPNPLNLPEINHKDCCSTNNNINNLEWISRM